MFAPICARVLVLMFLWNLLMLWRRMMVVVMKQGLNFRKKPFPKKILTLRCPDCGTENVLESGLAGVVCANCGESYSVHEGLPVGDAN